MSILVGEVIAVHGVKVSIKVFEESNKDTLFYDGTKYKGVSIREYVQIERGFKKLYVLLRVSTLMKSVSMMIIIT